MKLVSDGLAIAIAFGSVIIIIIGFVCDMYKRKTGYNRRKKKIQWEKVEAKITGHTRTGGKYTRKGRVIAEYTEYSIRYEVDGNDYVKWFNLYPGPDLGDVYGEGTSVLIKYNVNDPDEFEVIKVLSDR